MCHKSQYDITYNDLNPTLLFVSKRKMTRESSYHAHNDFTEITFILSGKGRYIVEDIDYEVEAGDLIICNPGVRHRNIIVNPKEPTVEFFAGFSDYQFKCMPQNCIKLKNGGYLLKPGTAAKREISEKCYEMLSENETVRPGKYFMLKAHLIQLLMIIIREIKESDVKRQEGYEFENYNKNYAVKRIISYLNQNYSNKISLDQIAHNMYLSPVYISKIFKEELGESPINYLIKIRLEKAREILMESDGSIKNIANEVGYEDVYHFSKLFKKYYGVSPLNYRKQQQAKKDEKKTG